VQFRVRRRENPVIEIAPLIDVVFLLLLFFMVTTQFVSMPGLSISLPGVKPGASVTATAKIDVQVTEAGDIYVAGNPISMDDFSAAVKRNAPDPASTVVVLMADERTTHGRIVSLMDALRRQGFKRVVMAARWEKEPQKR